LRGQFFDNEGKNPRRYFLGGTWSLRGWSQLSIRGTKLWQANAELRFPLLDMLYLKFPFGMVWGFPAIRGALYFDAGNCWDNSENYDFTRGSLGAGMRINLFNVIVLRYDFGKRIENNFTKLQDGLFQQVFFGWDF
jgi:outer membrane protein assembly factor BamA